MSRSINNAVLAPLDQAEGLMLVQDRRGHRPPPWDFFGGGIEAGETPLQAVIREADGELGLKLAADDLEIQKTVTGQLDDLAFQPHVFTWPVKGDLGTLTVSEGAGTAWVSPEEMLKRVEPDGPDYKITRLVRGLGSGSERPQLLKSFG